MRTLQESVYLIIPVHNRRIVTLNCLERLNKLDSFEKFSVVVIDDGSTDGTSKIIENKYPDVVLLYGDGTLWWTGAIELGMKYAVDRDADFIVWLNDDCLIESKTIEDLVNFVRCNSETIVGCIGYELSAPTKIAFGGKKRKIFNYEIINPSQQEIYPCDLLSGNLVCLPAKIIEDIGYPDADKCPHYGGDSHFLIRARKAGYSIFVDARHAAQNVATKSTSIMNSNQWLLGDTSTKELFRLIFTPQSILSWRVWWFLYTEDYGLMIGIVLFFVKLSKTIATLLCISVLRILPISVRKQLSLAKRAAEWIKLK